MFRRDDTPSIDDILNQVKDLGQSIEGMQDDLSVLKEQVNTGTRTLPHIAEKLEELRQGTQRVLSQTGQEGSLSEHATCLAGAIDSVAQLLSEVKTQTTHLTEFMALQLEYLTRQDDAYARLQSTSEGVKSVDARLESMERLMVRQFQAHPPVRLRESGVHTSWLTSVTQGLQHFGRRNDYCGQFAARLVRHVHDLSALLDDLDLRDMGYWRGGEGLDRLNREVNAVELGMKYEHAAFGLSENERDTIRALESAVLHFRLQVGEEVEQRTGVRLMRVTPLVTKFNPMIHESSGYYTRSTSEKSLDGLVYAVEEPGYVYVEAKDGLPKVLRRAVVGRLAYEPNDSEARVPTPEHIAESPDAGATHSDGDPGAEMDVNLDGHLDGNPDAAPTPHTVVAATESVHSDELSVGAEQHAPSPVPDAPQDRDESQKSRAVTSF